MFGTIKVVVGIAVVLVVAATIVAIQEDRVPNLLIGAAMVASNLAGFWVLMDRKLGDAYDTGGDARVRSLLARLSGREDQGD